MPTRTNAIYEYNACKEQYLIKKFRKQLKKSFKKSTDVELTIMAQELQIELAKRNLIQKDNNNG